MQNVNNLHQWQRKLLKVRGPLSLIQVIFCCKNLWRALKFKRDHGPPWPPISATFDLHMAALSYPHIRRFTIIITPQPKIAHYIATIHLNTS